MSVLLSVRVVLILLVCSCIRRKVAKKRSFDEEMIGLTGSIAGDSMPSESNLSAGDYGIKEDKFNRYDVPKKSAEYDEPDDDNEDPTYYSVNLATQRLGGLRHADEKASIVSDDETAAGVQGGVDEAGYAYCL